MMIKPNECKTTMAANICSERKHLGLGGVHLLLDRGREWDLAPTLLAKGSAFIPHAALDLCGHQIAAVVHAILNSGADRVLALGVLHLLNDELKKAREREKTGCDVTKEPLWGIQGPGLQGRTEWEQEYSLSNFCFLLEHEAKRRCVKFPHIIRRYPFLVAGRPDLLPGMKEIEAVAKDSVVIATGDLMHHGIGYLTPPEEAVPMDGVGPAFAQAGIQEGLDLLKGDDYSAFRKVSQRNKSDAHDVGQVLRYLLGPLEGHIHDVTLCDTSVMYRSAKPTWVAAALVELKPSSLV